MVLTAMGHQSIPGLFALSCQPCSFLGCQQGIVSHSSGDIQHKVPVASS